MKNIKQLVTITLLVIAIGAVAAYFYMKNDASIVTYSTEPVRIGNIEDVVLTNGVLYPYKMVNVGAQVSGKLESIAVTVGDTLKAGDVIAQIDNLSQENALKESHASLTNINAQYRAKKAQIYQSQLAFERQKAMLLKNASSQSMYDAAEAELLVYEAELDQLVAEKEKALISVDDAQLDLSYTKIESPIDGTVVYVSVEEGQTVNTNQSTPSIVEVAQLDVMTVKAQVSEADIIHIATGQKVYFSILGAPQHNFHGELKSIEPGPTLLTGDDSELNIGDNDAIYYNAVFDVDNTEGLLRFGMTAQVSIVLDAAQEALLVPSQVLTKKIQGKNRYRVPVLVEGALEMRNVEIGINNKVYAQVLDGLELGDRVVIGQANAKSSSGFDMSSTLGPEKGGRGNGGPGGRGQGNGGRP
ncbi:efflux RND transporter periplasmic adaptor subunit [Vibrio cyclitrophicus]|uniref:efflux RND transporter periplasmic adaptor subunit n=1 Tax=Vibrio cyclitrophicus TaxID=47951 RepID=UPI00030F9EEC|nr:efflux RND transporter periplasmic adaptor subunit [Vibrio cyclitrophicus]OED70417.1 efflux transporter periplasmic adaptor subunit [Vibrio cyclitrophicus ZF99]OEF38542.1 efflux transporter periplasmic adaptor subunit [Vibrio cyclitrophicus 1F289]PME20139.1 efflux transporter periplasmic adaptor subunit [Vibrio cyclitrophicus]PME74644.1 efflux transporter periplasmic adaptor subunit [Vibrio cyclitrophicus]PMF14814.1 efflux transporter periplasmic adaptor subunit [Vibrio cyclitrophicus]